MSVVNSDHSKHTFVTLFHNSTRKLMSFGAQKCQMILGEQTTTLETLEEECSKVKSSVTKSSDTTSYYLCLAFAT